MPAGSTATTANVWLTVAQRVALRARARPGRRAVHSAPERRLGVAIGEGELGVAAVAQRGRRARDGGRRWCCRVDRPAVHGGGAQPARAAPGRDAEAVVALGQSCERHRARARCRRAVVEAAVEAHAPPAMREAKLRSRGRGRVTRPSADQRRRHALAAVVGLVALAHAARGVDTHQDPVARGPDGHPRGSAGSPSRGERGHGAARQNARAAARPDQAVLDACARRPLRAEVSHSVGHEHALASPRRGHARHRRGRRGPAPRARAAARACRSRNAG